MMPHRVAAGAQEGVDSRVESRFESEATPSTFARIRVFKEPIPRDPRFPWGGFYPCCSFMGSGGGWPSWRSAMDQALRHVEAHRDEVTS